jgi:thioester reductase-like protein
MAGSGVLWNGPRQHHKKAMDLFLRHGVRSYPVVDVHRETVAAIERLQEVLTRCDREEVPRSSPWITRSILLTGSTGFIGSQLLSRVLTAFPQARVYCLVRGKNASHCKERIASACESLRVDVEATAWDRVVAVPGDITRHHFGLSAAAYDELLHTVDTVLHFAARDNFFLPFSVLYSAHVDCILELVEFCAKGKVKSLMHCSTCKVRMVDKFNGTPNYGLYNGYGQTKYVAHKIMEQLPRLRSEFRCTPPARIVNLGYVYSDRVPMLVPDITDAFESIFKVMLVTNCVPLVSGPCDFTPLSYATECIVAILQEDGRAEYDMASGPQCREIFMQRGLQFEDVTAAIQEIRGHTTQELPMEEFVPKWMEVLWKTGSHKAKFLSVLVTEKLEQHLKITFQEGTKDLYIHPDGCPPPMSKAYLLDLLRLIDQRMVLE